MTQTDNIKHGKIPQIVIQISNELVCSVWTGGIHIWCWSQRMPLPSRRKCRDGAGSSSLLFSANKCRWADFCEWLAEQNVSTKWGQYGSACFIAYFSSWNSTMLLAAVHYLVRLPGANWFLLTWPVLTEVLWRNCWKFVGVRLMCACRKCCQTFHCSQWLGQLSTSFTRRFLTAVYAFMSSPTPVVAITWVGWSVASVNLCVCMCPCSKRITAWAINTKLVRHRVRGSRMACFDPGVKTSKGHMIIKCAAGVGM